MKNNSPHKIGLCLSGGGSRAMAFHLGCLRSLHKYHILEKVSLLSCVSGGSVIGAMYAYSNDSFEEFENRVLCQLESGMQLKIFIDCLLRGKFVVGLVMFFLITILLCISKMISCLGIKNTYIHEFLKIRAFSCRASSLSKVINKLLYDNKTLSHETRGGMEIMINACEINTKTAFRFGNRVVSNRVFGKLSPHAVLVADAVAASAAYPLFISAMNRKFEFQKDGKVVKKWVLLSDGGVYENLGITPLLPNRPPDCEHITTDCDYVIACDAEHSTSPRKKTFQFLPCRIKACFDSLMKRIRSMNFNLLHEYKRLEKIKGFVLSCISYEDEKIFTKSDAFVPYERIADYPTSFRKMKREDIDAIVARGEQITDTLIKKYLHMDGNDKRADD